MGNAQPSPTNVIGHFETLFPELLQDCWSAARQSEAGRAVLRCSFPETAHYQKRRRVAASGDQLFSLLQSLRPEEHVLQAMSEMPSEELATLTEDCRRAASPLWLAAGRGYCQVVEGLLQAKADPNYGESLYFRSPLWEASWGGHSQCVTMLLAHKASIDLAPTSGPKPGRTSLMAAACRGKADVVSALLNAGANPHVRDAMGWNALEIARHPERHIDRESLVAVVSALEHATSTNS